MKLHHQYINNGKPLLVFVHGLLSSLDTFIPLIPLLEKENSLLLVDLRGHGATPPSGTDYTSEAMALDLKELVDDLRIKKFSIVGHSMGGRVALAFGKKFPEMIEKMIIEDMAIHARHIRSEQKDEEKRSIAKDAEVSSLTFNSKDEIFKLISPLYSYADNLLYTKVNEVDGKFVLKFWPHVSVLFGYQGNYTDLTSALTATNFPVLFINADPRKGSVLSATCVEHIEKTVPRAKIVVIENAGHSVHKTHPKQFVTTLLNFLHAT